MIEELSGKYTIKELCKEIGVGRSGFYSWRKNKLATSGQQKTRQEAMELFLEYHEKYPSHGYRWLNAKIKLDKDANYSDRFAHTVCKYLGIKSKAKKVRRYRKSKERDALIAKNFPNLILKDMEPERPLAIVVSDMTAFYYMEHYYELTLFMDLFNNEIITYYLTGIRGNPRAYYRALEDFLKEKTKQKDLETILHTDQGAIYMSKSFNRPLLRYNITHSVSKPGKPTENGAMEAINGWMKEELFIDGWLKDRDNVREAIEEYIYYFNNERPAYALNYLTPAQYKQKYYNPPKNVSTKR